MSEREKGPDMEETEKDAEKRGERCANQRGNEAGGAHSVPTRQTQRQTHTPADKEGEGKTEKAEGGGAQQQGGGRGGHQPT